MPEFTQANRPLRVNTPLGENKLLIAEFSGQEELSRLFHYQLHLAAELDTVIKFDEILGKPVCVEADVMGGQTGTRFFHGIVSRFSQGKRDQNFTYYSAELRPMFWLLTRITQSRIFQHMTVPDILKKVLTGLPVTWEIQGTFEPRDYCVQYRESDFDFASRLMEEEGIYYYFKHTKSGHDMVVANTPQSHVAVPFQPTLRYEDIEGGNRPDMRIQTWEKTQEIRSVKTVLWDHCFELPHKHLDAEKVIQDTSTVGTVAHKLKLPVAEKLELYDFPGEYAQRFDGIAPGGGDRAADIQKIFNDNIRTVNLRMQEEAAQALSIVAGSNAPQVTAGHHFTLDNHFNANGKYLITRVQHSAQLGLSFRSDGSEYHYSNQFHCMPFDLPYRPLRQTERPTVAGTQTAVVVGPKGEEIFTDKYGRVKVQFHWDRHGKNDADSSCWIRVATVWAGRQWGVIHIPRIGQEVVVDFLEGDPDQPIIVGSVYNADQMPPWALPANKTQSGIQTRSSLGGGAANHNQIRFEDKKGSEQLHIHAEKNQDIEVENDETHWVGHDRKKTIDHDETTVVKHDRTETVNNNETITIDGNRTETVHKNEAITIDINQTIHVGANRTETVGANESITIGANRTRNVAVAETVTIGAAQAITVGGARAVTVGAGQAITIGAAQMTTVGSDDASIIGGNRSETVGKDQSSQVAGNRVAKVAKDDTIDVGKNLKMSAADSITLITGDASITMKKDGTITIKGKDITVDGSGKINVTASKNITMKGQKILQN
ncbi:MAG: type VI secretion system tip protein TssI/VgrG [Gemmatales bacterium]